MRQELQLLCRTLESQKRSLEQELLQLREAAPAPEEVSGMSVLSATEREQSEKIETLEMENSKLQLAEGLAKTRTEWMMFFSHKKLMVELGWVHSMFILGLLMLLG